MNETRRSGPPASVREELRLAGAVTPDFFFDSLFAEEATAELLRALIESLSEGPL